MQLYSVQNCTNPTDMPKITVWQTGAPRLAAAAAAGSAAHSPSDMLRWPYIVWAHFELCWLHQGSGFWVRGCLKRLCNLKRSD